MNSVQVMEKKEVSPITTAMMDALVYCPICTHSVQGKVRFVRNAAGRKVASTIAGQSCSRCASPLDAAVVLRVEQAA
jgi:hypothetical protein